jgi:hypothetical protein
LHKEKIMLKAIAAGLALTMTLVAGCSSDSEGSQNAFSCENAKSKCPNDPPLPVAECKEALGHPKCGNVVLALFICIGEHQTCASDGTTDQDATERACSMQANAVRQCDAMGDAGGGG